MVSGHHMALLPDPMTTSSFSVIRVLKMIFILVTLSVAIKTASRDAITGVVTEVLHTFAQMETLDEVLMMELPSMSMVIVH
jgi:hypothetical protein